MWSLLFALGSAAAQTVPSLQTETLSGKAIALPSAAAADRTLLLLGFRMSHQQDFEAWRPLVGGCGGEWLELPFVDVGRVLRGVIRGAMSRQIADPAIRERYAPVWGSPAAVMSALGLASDEAMAAVVIDRSGKVLWRRDGPPAPGDADGLCAAIVP